MMFRKVIGYRHIATMLANSSALYVRFKSIEIINVRIHKHKTLQQEFSQYLYRSFGHIPLQDTEAFFGRRNIHSMYSTPSFLFMV